MPILYYALLGITTVGTALLVVREGVEVADNGAQKAIVTGVAIIGLYASYKMLVKK